jgi:hypothetical protein
MSDVAAEAAIVGLVQDRCAYQSENGAASDSAYVVVAVAVELYNASAVAVAAAAAAAAAAA